MDKIYSRKRINLNRGISNGMDKKRKIDVVVKIIIIFIIGIVTAEIFIDSIKPTVISKCENIAKGIATKVCNEQTSLVMQNYKYDDLCNVTKDDNGNVKMVSANTKLINDIILQIPVKIQNELNSLGSGSLKIPLGSFTSSKFLSGRGPNVELKIGTIGNIGTDLKSEFTSVGINQTIHKMYLQIDCTVTILTPFENYEQKVNSQVLLAEAVIIGTTPETYYNLTGLEKSDYYNLAQ